MRRRCRGGTRAFKRESHNMCMYMHNMYMYMHMYMFKISLSCVTAPWRLNDNLGQDTRANRTRKTSS